MVTCDILKKWREIKTLCKTIEQHFTDTPWWRHQMETFSALSYVHTCAERRRADFDIPAPLPRVCSHIRGADAGGSAISWGQWWFEARGFEADAVNWVLDPFLAERFLLPLRLRSATAHVWTHVMICVEANFPPAPARVRPRMCERTFTGPLCGEFTGRGVLMFSLIFDLMFSLIFAWTIGWSKQPRRQWFETPLDHYDVTVMNTTFLTDSFSKTLLNCC